MECRMHFWTPGTYIIADKRLQTIKPLLSTRHSPGRWAHARRRPAPRDSGSTGRFGPGWPTAAEIDAELGGADGFFTLCGLHYCNLFANPRMAVLFDTRRPDSAASAMDHGATRAPTARARRGRATRARRARTEA